MLTIKNLSKSFQVGGNQLHILRDINFEIKEGDVCALTGPSGSGKTTLLGLCAGLDKPTTGTILLNKKNLNELSENELATFRNRHVGFIFQNFQLIPTLTALENIAAPLALRGDKSFTEKAKDLLNTVGIYKRQNHYPLQLSGGEQQRVAIARCFITNPKIIFADEPTGSLDYETGLTIENLLFSINETQKTSLLIVTHSRPLAKRTKRILILKKSSLYEQ